MIISHSRCRATLSRTADRINSALEQNFWLYALLVVLSLFICFVIQDMRLKLWYDEFFTLYIAKQGSPAAIVKATMEAADAAPPAYSIIVSSILSVVKLEALAVRLPSTFGFCGMLLCILAFCRRRMPAVYAFSASLFASTASVYYATEGRCYGLVLFCAAGSLLCWQKATETKPRPLPILLLAVCLMLMVALHYYSIFFLVPLVCAEMARWRTSGKADFAILGAMVPALGTLLLHYPLIAAGRSFVPHFWPPGVAEWRRIPEFYLRFFSLIPACSFLVALMAHGIFAEPLANRQNSRARFPSHEWVAIGVLGLMPFVVVAVAKFTIHVFVYRYTLWAVIGLAILAAAILCVRQVSHSVVGLAVLGLLLSVLAGQQFGAFRRTSGLRDGETIRRALEAAPDGSTPIVIGYDHAFMELSYYADARLRNRILYPISRSLDLKYKGFDVDSLSFPALRRRTNLRILDLETFLEANPHFLIATHPQDYLPRYLLAAGYRLVPIDSRSPPILYEVEAPIGQGAKGRRASGSPANGSSRFIR